MNPVNNNNALKVIGFILVVAVIGQGYMIYDLKNSINNQRIGLEQMKPVERVEPRSVSAYMLDPFREFQIMQQDFDKTFSRFNSLFANDPYFKSAFDDFSYKPLLDISSNSDAYVIKTDIPGVDKSNIEIKAENGILSIKAEIRDSKDSNSTNFISKERYVKKFERVISLEYDADVSKIKSEYTNGVLTITIPKK